MQVLKQDNSIMHPLVLLQKQLTNKTLKKSSLQNINTIALCLGKLRCQTQLIPYMTNLFAEQTLQYKAIIIKSLLSIGKKQYLNRKGLYLALSFLIDVLCVYSEKQIRDIAIESLKMIVENIQFNKAQRSLLKLSNNLYSLFKNKEGQKQVSQNIEEVFIILVSLLYDKMTLEYKKQLSEIIQQMIIQQKKCKFINILIQQLLVCQKSKETQSFVYKLLKWVIQTCQIDIINKIINSLIKYRNFLQTDSLKHYFHQILTHPDNQTFCLIITNISCIEAILEEEDLNLIYSKIDNFQDQPQEIKNAILTQIDKVQSVIEKDSLNDFIAISSISKSNQLKTVLVETLCNISSDKRTESLEFSHKKLQRFLLDEQISKDINFLIKFFPKLPKNITELHLQVIGRIMANKSWRQKLTILQNLQQRIDQNENVDKLFGQMIKYVGDKIACIRIAVSNILSKLLQRPELNRDKYLEIVQQIVKQNKIWYERQTSLLIINNFLNFLKINRTQIVKPSQKLIILQIVSQSKKQNIKNIQNIFNNLQQSLNQLQW